MPEIHELLKSQKNEVFEIIKDEGLEPANFSWDTLCLSDEDVVVPRLNYLDGKYYFIFDLYEGNHHYAFSPGRQIMVQEGMSDSWGTQRHFVRVWARCLKKEANAPDLWTEMEKYKTSVSLVLPEQLLNEPISASEAEEIAEKIGILAERIEQQFQLTSEQDKFVRNKLNYLAEAAKRQRGSDWVHTSIGVFITIVTALALAPERAKELWLLFKSILGGFIHLIG